MKTVIVGAGVIGLMSAYYLRRAGFDVIVADRTDGTDNCSFGNAGYISPSHIIPLSSPGIVAQGLKWLLSASSPFYIKPRLSGSLVKWGWKFYKNATEEKVNQSAPHLYNISMLSRQLTVQMDRDLRHGFGLQTKGCFMLYKTQKTAKAEAQLSEMAKKFGLEAPILTAGEIRSMEPAVSSEILGGVYFPDDCHINPPGMMATMQSACRELGVEFKYGHEVKGFETHSSKVTGVITDKELLSCDHLVLAGGSWLESLGAKLGIMLPVQPGKGYSVTYNMETNNIRYPAIIVDERVAITPMPEGLRVGGTMELSGHNFGININRVFPIIRAANSYYPGLNLEMPRKEQVWAGLRPCSPDGLPYIGPSPSHQNVTVAGGHAMVGISLAAATGYLVRQIIMGEKTEIPIEAFRVER